VFGIDPHLRNSFKTWQEGDHTPDVVFEFTSKKTRREDTHTKRPLYEQRLRVPEYFQFDPTADYLRPPLQGMRLIGDEYKPIELVGGRLHSEQLGIEMAANGSSLDFYRSDTGEKLLNGAELARRTDFADRRADFADRRADVADRRADVADRRAEDERHRAELADRRAEDERRRADQLAAENAALKQALWREP
jgi:hypothetical protein